MRIFIGQRDQWERRPLSGALLTLFRSKGLAGATVLQGLAGFGPSSILHEMHLLRLSQDLPIASCATRRGTDARAEAAAGVRESGWWW